MKCKTCKRDLPKGAIYCCWCGKYQLNRATQTTHLPKARQLPSGNWRIYLEREKQSITAPTREECVVLAAQYRQQWEKDEAAGLHIPPPPVTTLRSVIESYIASRKSIRSPSTIDGYENILRNRFKKYMPLDVNTIDFQQMINDELGPVSAKTVCNAWGLVRSALVQSKIQFEPPALPRTVKPEKNWLDYAQINDFLAAIRKTPYELAALLALHSLRKSEILGLHISDYDSVKKIIHVRGALLATANGYVYTSLNKTDTSSRDIPIIIPRLASLLDNIYNNYYFSPSQASHRNVTDYLVRVPDNNLHKAINKICRQANLPEVGVHGLRHSFASLAYHLGWKKKSTMAIGGWSNSKILDEIYTHNADLEADVKTMQDFFVPESVPESNDDS